MTSVWTSTKKPSLPRSADLKVRRTGLFVETGTHHYFFFFPNSERRQCYIHRRYLCPKFERQSFHEYAGESILWSRWAAAFYLLQRQSGKSHHSAVRALAFKWQRVIWRCWQNRVAYDEKIYETALRKSNSPIVPLLDQIQLGKSPFKTTRKNITKTVDGLPQR